jgi:hypothetical protein
MRNPNENPKQYEARKTAFLKMRTRMITNRLRNEVEKQLKHERQWNSMTAAQRMEANDIAHLEWLNGC